MKLQNPLNKIHLVALTALTVGMQTDAAIAQDGPTEFSSAPCSSLALGPTDEVVHLRRTYLLQGAEQTTQYRFFADENCTLPMYTMVFQGGIALGDPVPGLQDTVEATVRFDRVLFTLDSPRGAAAAAECGDGQFEIGIQRDVSDDHCLFMQPRGDCGFDYDVVQILNGVATPGFRTADMCAPEGRPTRLQSAGATFVEQF